MEEDMKESGKGCILLLEDEESLNRGIAFKLDKEGYQVLTCGSVREGLELYRNNTVDLIICDISLKDGNGLDFCREIRKTDDTRLIFLTALDTEIDIVMGYEAGADDYVTKPFSLSVLLSKVNAVFKRMSRDYREILHSGAVAVSKEQMKVTVAGEDKNLTKNEFRLLIRLMEHPKQILSKQQLLESLWDMEGEYVDENTIAVNIRRLREKIEQEPSRPEYIKNVRGIGYVWDQECTK